MIDFTDANDLEIFFDAGGTEFAVIVYKDEIYITTEEEYSEGATPSTYNGQELFPANRRLVFCESCGALVWDHETNPDVSDDTTWEMMTLQHQTDCEWISSRAFRV